MEGKGDNFRITSEISETSKSSASDSKNNSSIATISGYDALNIPEVARLPLPANHTVKIDPSKVRIVNHEEKDGDQKTTKTIRDITKPPTSDVNQYVWYGEMFRKQRRKETTRQVTRALAVGLVAMFITLCITIGVAVLIWNRDKL